MYFIYDYCFIYYIDTYVLVWNVLKYELELWVINVFIREKFLRLTMSFGYFMYSHSLVPVIDPWGSGCDKVGIRAWVFIVDFQIIVLCFYYTTAVLGCQMSVLSSLFPIFCVVSVCYCVDFIWFVFSEWEVVHEILLLLKQLIMLSSPFRAKLLLLLLNVEEEVAMVEECCLMLYLIYAWFRNGFVGLILWYSDC